MRQRSLRLSERSLSGLSRWANQHIKTVTGIPLYMAEAIYEFYSQQGEDVFVFRNFLNKPVSDGVFVEVGAFDGVQGSNTKFFEDVLGYRGVLVEPVGDHIPNIVARRPNSKVYNCAIHPTACTVDIVGNSATAGIPTEMSETHRETWFAGEPASTQVHAGRLDALLEHAGISHVDFMSIDVEGAELLVLETMNWSIETFVICIELDGTNPAKDAECRCILKDRGFTFQTYIGNNDIWVNLNYSKQDRYSQEMPPYSAVCRYFNAQTYEELPVLLENFRSPLDVCA